mmetsp:Transcript_19637/g.75377  ORF Transcript_19637/g.75377 Transcript_19637/m.75377 type:complete len:365 (+) Transcript_19637:6051-7145(+)
MGRGPGGGDGFGASPGWSPVRRTTSLEARACRGEGPEAAASSSSMALFRLASTSATSATEAPRTMRLRCLRIRGSSMLWPIQDPPATTAPGSEMPPGMSSIQAPRPPVLQPPPLEPAAAALDGRLSGLCAARACSKRGPAWLSGRARAPMRAVLSAPSSSSSPSGTVGTASMPEKDLPLPQSPPERYGLAAKAALEARACASGPPPSAEMSGSASSALTPRLIMLAIGRPVRSFSDRLMLRASTSAEGWRRSLSISTICPHWLPLDDAPLGPIPKTLRSSSSSSIPLAAPRWPPRHPPKAGDSSASSREVSAATPPPGTPGGPSGSDSAMPRSPPRRRPASPVRPMPVDCRAAAAAAAPARAPA